MPQPLTHEVESFTVGETYTNDQIRFSLNVENLGGIRPALDGQKNVRHIAILTAEKDSGKLFSDNPYKDRVEGDVLVYTAQGRVGDQTLAGRNKRLLEQYFTPVPFLGFTNVGKQSYRFLGLLELLRHYQERQVDRICGLRLTWVFEFRIHSNPSMVPIAFARQVMADIIENSDSRPDKLLTQIDVGQPSPMSEDGESLARQESLRAQMLQLPPPGFEHFLQMVMLHSGFTDVEVVGKSGDGGIDLTAIADESNSFFSGTHVHVQAKRWRHSVGNVEINHFRGAVSPKAKGVFITTSIFTTAAEKEAAHPTKPTITLIDGLKLAKLVDGLKVSVA